MLGFFKKTWAEAGVSSTLKQMGFSGSEVRELLSGFTDNFFTGVRATVENLSEQQKNIISTWAVVTVAMRDSRNAVFYHRLDEVSVKCIRALGVQLMNSSFSKEDDIAKAFANVMFLVSDEGLSLPNKDDVEAVKELLRRSVDGYF